LSHELKPAIRGGKGGIFMRYSPERKEAVLRKMMPPHNRTIRELAKEERISENQPEKNTALYQLR